MVSDEGPGALGALHLFGGHALKSCLEGLGVWLVGAVGRRGASRGDLFGSAGERELALLVVFHKHPSWDTLKAWAGRMVGGVSGGLGGDRDRLALCPSGRLSGSEVGLHLSLFFVHAGVFFSSLLLVGSLILWIFEVGHGLGVLEVGLLFLREGLLFAATVDGDVADICGPFPSVVLRFIVGVICHGEVAQFDLRDLGLHIPNVSLDGLEEGSQLGEEVVRWCWCWLGLRYRWGIDSSQGDYWLSLFRMPG